MVWLAIITVCVLVAKVVLATVLPAARRNGVDPAGADPHMVAQEGQWLNLTDIHGYHQTPVRVRVSSPDDFLRR